MCSTKVWNDTAHRYLHAKALLLDFGDRLALMSGSANPSRPAWISGERTNFEAMLLRTSLGEADQGIVDELLSAFAAPTMTAEDLNAVAARLPDSSSNTSAQCLPVCIAPVDQMGRVIIPTRTPTGLISAQAFSSHPQGDRTVPVTKDASGDYVVALGEHHTSVRWLVLSTDGDPDLRVIVQHPQEVRRADADSKRLDLMNALGALSDSVDIDWERLVSLAAPVIFSNELDEVDNSPDNSFREGSHRSDAGDHRGKRRPPSRGQIGELLDALFRRKRSGKEQASGTAPGSGQGSGKLGGKERRRSLEGEEDNIGKEDEVYVPQGDQAATDKQIKAISQSLTRVLSRMHKELDEPSGADDDEAKLKPLHKTLTQLLVVLLLVREFRKSRLEPKWRRADGFVKAQQKCALLSAAAKRLFRRADGMAAQLLGTDGTEPEELTQVRALLAWLAWDIGYAIQSPIPPLSAPQDQREAAWRNALLYELLPSIVRADAGIELLRESIRMTRRPFETSSADAWLHRYLDLGLDVATRLDDEFKTVASAAVGDLVRVPNTSPPTVKVASVVTEGRITVIEFEGADGYGGRSFSPQHSR